MPSSTASKRSAKQKSTNAAANMNSDKPAHIPVRSTPSTSTWNPIKLIERKLFQTYWNVEATFVLSMLEAWEVCLVIVVFLILTFLTWYSLIHYFPRHAQLVLRRAAYYIYGTNSTSTAPPLTAQDIVSKDAALEAVQAISSLGSSAIQSLNETSANLVEKLIASSSILWSNLEHDAAAAAAASSTSSDEAAAKLLQSNPDIVDTLINNLNYIKELASQSASAAAQKLDL
ncbi:hypothetical protein BCV70DRAFT_199324 [Testicularia cyperi]|uniref:Uncharacterized protein n=1 Tax=Testicularia cyperi TaxID=1882483 RepID=A0A317XUB3_9BASI|nr:hypothetical protein BCV70DRAFT_199324 [Testicularia cyperi]